MPLKIIYWNTHHLTNKVETLIETLLTDNIDIALLQDTATNQGGPIDSRVPVIPGYSVVSIAKSDTCHGLVCIIKDGIPVTNIQHNIKLGLDTEVHTIKVKLFRKLYYIHNIYNSKGNVMDILTLLDTYKPSIVVGDFNLHHKSWCKSTDRAGKHLYDQMQQLNNYIIINKKHTPTFPTRNGGTTIDLCIMNTELAPHCEWDLHPSLISDHHACIITINKDTIATKETFIPKWVIDKANWKEFGEYITLNLPPPNDDINTETRQITNTIVSAAKVAIPVTKPITVKKDTWYKDFLVRATKTSINSLINKCRTNKTYLPQLKEANLEFQMACKNAKAQSWHNWATECNDQTNCKKLWNRIRLATNNVPKQLRHEDPMAKSIELSTQFSDRCKTTHLPQTTQAKLQQQLNQNLTIIEEAIAAPSDADTPIVMHELTEAMKNKKDTSPGMDSITYSMIIHSPICVRERIVDLYNKIMRVGHLPDEWKMAKIVAIPKPGQPDAYRPISLLPVISKLFERVILKRLQFICRPLHQHTMGFKKKQGTMDAVATFISDLTHNKPNGNNTEAIAVYIDLEKAFELANKEMILRELIKAGAKGKLIQILRDYLSERRATVTFQGSSSPTVDFENGTPQGSALSPTLFNYLIDKLVTIKMPLGIKVVAYADDLILYTTNRNRRQCRNIMPSVQKALDTLCDAATGLGLKFSEAKTKATYFHCVENPNTFLTLSGQPIEWTRCYRYLGVMINDKLTIKDHVKFAALKANKKMNALKVLAKCSGVNASVLKLVYMATIQPTLEYGMHIANISSDTCLDELRKIQNSACRIITDMPRWTNVLALRHEVQIPPLELTNQIHRAQYVHKVLTNKEHPLHTRAQHDVIKDRRLFKNNTSWCFISTSEYLKLAPRNIIPNPSKEVTIIPPWKEIHIRTIHNQTFGCKADIDPEDLRVVVDNNISALELHDDKVYYTDGSVKDNRASAAFVTHGVTYSVRLSDHTTILQAELTAILKALQHATTNQDKRIIIHTDSLSAIHVLKSRTISDNFEIINNIFTVCKDFAIAPVIHWIPSHIGIAGNEAADTAATGAITNDVIGITIEPSLSSIRKNIKCAALSKWNEITKQKDSETVRWNIQFDLTKEQHKCLWTLPRELQVQIFKLRLYYRNFQIVTTKSTTCQHCGENITQMVTHYLAECTATYRQRSPMLHTVNNYATMAPKLLAATIMLNETGSTYKHLKRLLYRYKVRQYS